MKITKSLKAFRMAMEGFAFLLVISCIVWLIVVCSHLPERFPLAFDENGKISEWGTPFHFIIVFIAGMLVYGGLSVIIRFKNIFGVSLFINEHKGKTKYEATLLLFSLLKVYALSLFLIVMFNMYARVRNSILVQPVDWLLYAIMGLTVLTIATYTIAFAVLNKRKKTKRSRD